MSVSVRLERTLTVPDPVEVERCQRLPELGPKILFFSGGSALRSLSRKLKRYTTNSIHLITPFDSGGSSALLRQAFGMPSVGDLRNRLMALADETVRGNPQIYRLFSHRFPVGVPPETLKSEFDSMVTGEHSLVSAVPSPMQRLIRTHLRIFRERMPDRFDFSNASIGNLILAGGYLNNERDMNSVVFLFSQLVEVRGRVSLVAEADHHMRARLSSGVELVGQHLITGKTVAPIDSEIIDVRIVDSLDDPRPVEVSADRAVEKLIGRADLICYPMGSFYSSVIANLLPAGVGRAVARSGCPKVYVPNTGSDPEQKGLTVASSVERLVDYVRRDAGRDTDIGRILDLVLLDEENEPYEMPVDVRRIEDMGVKVMRLPLADAEGRRRLDPVRLAEALLSLT